MEKNQREKKFTFNNQYYTISVFTIVTVLICAVLIKALFMWDVTKSGLHSILKWSIPFTLGIFLALLLYPLVIWLEQNVFDKTNLSKAWKRKVSVILIYIVFLAVVVIGFCVIIPQIGDSISTLIAGFPRWYNHINHLMLVWVKEHPDMASIQKIIEDYGQDLLQKFQIETWVKEIAMNLVSTSISIVSTSISIVSIAINAIITLIISLYLLMDTESFYHGGHRIMYALMSEERVAQVDHVSAECYSIFSQYVSGKILDSLIIGVICFIAMTCLKLPYALIISVIVGITNMIPYFGPYIGAIPGTFILLMISPMKALIYLIMIVILQQFDGLVLGPRILGNSTGLGPAWIIFSVSAGGAIGGVLGMFVGVPVVAMIGHIIGIFVDYRIQKRKDRGELTDIADDVLESGETKRIKSGKAKNLQNLKIAFESKKKLMKDSKNKKKGNFDEDPMDSDLDL